MSADYRSISTATGTTTSLSVNKPSGTSDNDVLVAVVSYGGGVSLTAPSGWTFLREASLNSNNKLACYYKVASSEPASQNWAQSGANQILVAIIAVSGADTTAPINTHGQNLTAAGNFSIDAPSAVSTVPGGFVLRAAREASGNPQTSSWASGATEIFDPASGTVQAAITVAYDTTNQSSAGATGTKLATWTGFAGTVQGAVTLVVAPLVVSNSIRMVV